MPLTFGSTTPNAMVDAMHQRVLEAFDPHGAFGADTLRDLDTRTVRREERARTHGATPTPEHPRVLIGSLFCSHQYFNKTDSALIPFGTLLALVGKQRVPSNSLTRQDLRLCAYAL